MVFKDAMGGYKRMSFQFHLNNKKTVNCKSNLVLKKSFCWHSNLSNDVIRGSVK